jgi:glycosyltransferase involved in cell wall biosynthesis
MTVGADRRVLIIVQNLPVPFDRRVWLEATTLVRAGYGVSVICPKAKGFIASRETLEAVDIYRYSLPFEANGALGFIAEFAWCLAWTFFLSIRVAVMGRGFDVLHVCNPPETYWTMGWFWRLFGKRFIFDHHDLSPEMFSVKFEGRRGFLFRALLFCERMTFKIADLVITTNDSHKAIAIGRGGKSPDDVYVVRSGPDLSRFKIYEKDPAWRGSNRHLIVYLGEICKQDGVDHLLRALKHMCEAGRGDFHCVIVGGGPHQKQMVAYAAQIGVGDLCTFTGRVSDDDLCRILSSADVAVDPDPKNPWSDKSTMNKIVEYMYFGIPVVAYDLAEARVSAGEAAQYVEANDERCLAAAIAGLLDDSARRDKMANIGKARVRDALAWEYSVPPLLAAYDKVFHHGAL